MKETRPLYNGEIRRVSASFAGTFEARNRGLIPAWCLHWRTHHETTAEIIKLG